MTNLAKVAALAGAFVIGYAIESASAQTQPEGTVVELESPLASSHPLVGYMRRPKGGAGPSPAVVLLHSCHGDWRRIDERWGKRIASGVM
ncbi:hypothetical protein [Bradyrhizobium sp. CSA112]|uniref:hypothetical protein n=1 Tax=Bradyrhizobium sp. CSA112 TaxID=2699170 RepID=UPI0023AFEA9F|nr:hypothetical protein [Bradyrhizobium sp. CSA112]